MKIIGKTVSGFILEASKNEVAEIVGTRTWGELESLSHKGRGLIPGIGHEIKVAALFRQHGEITSMGAEIAKAQSILMGCHQALNDVPPIRQPENEERDPDNE